MVVMASMDGSCHHFGSHWVAIYMLWVYILVLGWLLRYIFGAYSMWTVAITLEGSNYHKAQCM